MDLSKLNTQSASDTATRVELVDPFDGTPLKDEDGKTLAAHILGMQSTVARNMDAKHRRESPKAEKKLDDMSDDEKQAFLEELQAFGKTAGAEKLAQMVTKLEGKWEADGQALKASDNDALQGLFESQDWLTEQLIAHAKTLANYRPKT